MRIVVTVDTEADGQWEHGRSLATANVAAWPSFQELCRRHAVPPTWLITSEIADDPAAVGFLRPLALAGEVEVGAHLHPTAAMRIRAISNPSSCSPSSRR